MPAIGGERVPGRSMSWGSGLGVISIFNISSITLTFFADAVVYSRLTARNESMFETLNRLLDSLIRPCGPVAREVANGSFLQENLSVGRHTQTAPVVSELANDFA